MKEISDEASKALAFNIKLSCTRQRGNFINYNLNISGGKKPIDRVRIGKIECSSLNVRARRYVSTLNSLVGYVALSMKRCQDEDCNKLAYRYLRTSSS